jgi:hypothetical protein
MASQFTITGKVGPGNTVTSQLIADVVRFEYLTAPKSMLFVQTSEGKIYEFDISADTTWTITLSSGNVTVVVS